MKIVKTHKKIQNRHIGQNYIWKKLHQLKMCFCKHSIEPILLDEYSYVTGKQYGECIHCEALCEIQDV